MAPHVVPQHAKAMGKQWKLIIPNLSACRQRVTQDNYREAIVSLQSVSDFAIVDFREFSLHGMEDLAPALSLCVLRVSVSALHNSSGKLSKPRLFPNFLYAKCLSC